MTNLKRFLNEQKEVAKSNGEKPLTKWQWECFFKAQLIENLDKIPTFCLNEKVIKNFTLEQAFEIFKENEKFIA